MKTAALPPNEVRGSRRGLREKYPPGTIFHLKIKEDKR